jgi:hypothetical protein
MLALGEDGTLVPPDLLDGPPGPVGDLLGREPGPDQRLDVARPHTSVDLDLELAEPRTVASGGSPQRLVEKHAVPLALGIGQQQVLAVLMDTDQPQIAHCLLPYRHIDLDSAIPDLAAKATTPRRYF